MAELCRRNVARNRLAGRAAVVEGVVRRVSAWAVAEETESYAALGVSEAKLPG